MEYNLVAEGLKFMVLGMVTVFLFLIVMVYILNLQSKLVQKYFPQKKKQVAKVANSGTVSSSKKDDNLLVAVITAAVTQHRNQNT